MSIYTIHENLVRHPFNQAKVKTSSLFIFNIGDWFRLRSINKETSNTNIL